MTALPSAQTPLYSHPLPALERWLEQLGACRSQADPCRWELSGPHWSASIELESEELKVSWLHQGRTVVRLFSYGLSRDDVESAIQAGP